MKTIISLLLILCGTICSAQNKRVQSVVNWTETKASNFCYFKKNASLEDLLDSPIIFQDDRDIATRKERDTMCYRAFVEALNNLTYCFPDIKSGYLMGLNSDVRDNFPLKLGWNKVCKRFEDITYGESIIPDFHQLSFKYPMLKETNKGDWSGNVHIILKWEYVATQRFDSVYSRLDFSYKSTKAAYSGCHCLMGNIDDGIETYNKSDCISKNQKDVSDCYYFKPKGFLDEVVEATIYIYPQIFEEKSYLFEGGKGEWIGSRSRSLIILFLHELGHLEQQITHNVKWGEKVSVGEGEKQADTFAYSVLRCVE